MGQPRRAPPQFADELAMLILTAILGILLVGIVFDQSAPITSAIIRAEDARAGLWETVRIVVFCVICLVLNTIYSFTDYQVMGLMQVGHIIGCVIYYRMLFVRQRAALAT